jgi:hypothetical protein
VSVWAGHREVWTATHGRAARYHVANEYNGAVCSPAITLRGGNRRIILVPEILRCARPACKKRWPP